MKPLLYHVPVVHGVSDLGSLGPMIERRRREVCPGNRWNRHKAVVDRFWNGIDAFFQIIDARGLKIYQDGMMSGGALGLKIIREGAATGSRNHQVVLDLLQRGACLQPTEDIGLLKLEYQRVLELARRQSHYESTAALLGYKAAGDQILEKRDRFVAQTIGATLKPAERGVLFMGAFHDVTRYLSDASMEIRQVKDPVKMRRYLYALIGCVDDRTFEDLATEMMTPPQGLHQKG
jgi:hypothetical protein